MVEEVTKRIAKDKWQRSGQESRKDQEKWTYQYTDNAMEAKNIAAEGRKTQKALDDKKKLPDPCGKGTLEDQVQWNALGEFLVQKWMKKGCGLKFRALEQIPL